MALVERLAGWMRESVAAAGAQGLVVGLSGGVDSAVVARLAQLATPGEVLGVVMPCHSDPQDERDAAMLAKHFSLPTVRMDLSQPYDSLIAALKPGLEAVPHSIQKARPHDDPRARVPLANIKPRLRMASLYFVANSMNSLVAGTGNRSELAIGYFTEAGRGVDLLPLGQLVKSEVWALARELGVPTAIVDRTPTAGLWLGQTDEAEMGFSYGDLERYLSGGPQAIPPALAMKIERLTRASEHKRQLPPMPEFDDPERFWFWVQGVPPCRAPQNRP
jgi:NAD+ synthase